MSQTLIVPKGHSLKWSLDGSLWGESVALGKVWFVGGTFVEGGVQMREDEFSDVIAVSIDGSTLVVDGAESIRSYDQLVTALIRTRYSLDAELALAANLREDPGRYAPEDAAFRQWRLKCKAAAKAWAEENLPA